MSHACRGENFEFAQDILRCGGEAWLCILPVLLSLLGCLSLLLLSLRLCLCSWLCWRLSLLCLSLIILRTVAILALIARLVLHRLRLLILWMVFSPATQISGSEVVAGGRSDWAMVTALLQLFDGCCKIAPLDLDKLEGGITVHLALSFGYT